MTLFLPGSGGRRGLGLHSYNTPMPLFLSCICAPFAGMLPTHGALQLFLVSDSQLQLLVTQETPTLHTSGDFLLCSLQVAWILDSNREERKQEKKKNKLHTHTNSQIPTLLHIMGGNSKMSVREQRDVCLPHLLQQAAAPNPRSPAAVYTGDLRGTAGEMPKQCLFLGSSNPCWKSSNDSLQLCRSQYTSAQTEGRRDSVTPALYFKAKVKFVASAVAGNGSAFISHLSAQPTTCSLFDLQLWSPSKKASKCR